MSISSTYNSLPVFIRRDYKLMEFYNARQALILVLSDNLIGPSGQNAMTEYHHIIRRLATLLVSEAVALLSAYKMFVSLKKKKCSIGTNKQKHIIYKLSQQIEWFSRTTVAERNGIIYVCLIDLSK